MDFGEIIEPASRAFWDGLDEVEGGNALSAEVEWEEVASEFLNCESINLLLIMEGSNLTEFCKAVLLKDQFKSCHLQGAKLTAFINEEAKMVICLSEESNLNLSSIITDRLVPCLRSAKEVVVISVLPKIAYKGEDLNDFQDVAFVKGINSKFDYAHELEPPNFMTGACAGGASWRYINDLPVSCYIVYTDSEDLDTLSAKPIIRLMQNIGLKCDEKYVPKVKDHSNLYM